MNMMELVKGIHQSLIKEIERMENQNLLSHSPAPALDDAATVVQDMLQRLEEVDMTVEILKETKIGITVSKLKKNTLFGTSAKTLIKKWKKLLDCSTTATSATNETSAANASITSTAAAVASTTTNINTRVLNKAGFDPSQYSFFWETVSPFSQWHLSTYELEGHSFRCTEQGMMYGKARLFGDHDVAQKILKEKSPRKMKALGRKVSGFSPKLWNQHREQIVYKHNLAKFKQNLRLQEALLATGNTTIVEASPSDAIWGIGLRESTALKTPIRQWPGLNLLGLVLMRVRKTIQAEKLDLVKGLQNSLVEEMKMIESECDDNKHSSTRLETVKKILTQLEECDMTLDILKETKIGHVISKLKKNPFVEAQARALITKWRQQAESPPEAIPAIKTATAVTSIPAATTAAAATTGPTEVICVRKKNLNEIGFEDFEDWASASDRHVYIGRNMSYYVPGTIGSKWKNPYTVKKYGLEESLRLYEIYIRSKSDLMNALSRGELKGKVLGCWCRPEKCHGDVLVKLMQQQKKAKT